MGSQEIQHSFIFLIWACLITLCLSSYDLILSDQYSILGHDDQLESFLSEEQVVELFQHWTEKHQRVYRLPEEAEKRFENFKRNLNFILEKNARKGRSPNGYQLGLNVFADLSNEEFRKIYLSNLEWPEEKESNLMRRRFQSCDAPLNLDWREKNVVTGVKNQGSCGKFHYLFDQTNKLI
ncbi:Peptidase C1A [Parasponia andersonii]|uniref:Peptidase C1A n=1 Tax=Parasponia andersonii TaxID=3476 RepID=A0A2P5DUP1_PARAD|nr:Peptidase C1A [Parasponia andersonii]